MMNGGLLLGLVEDVSRVRTPGVGLEEAAGALSLLVGATSI